MADQEIDTRLVDAKLKWRAWKMPKPTWDHDHCEFCWAKFMEPGNPDTLPEGYWVEAQDAWICKECFEKRRGDHHWVVVE